MEIIVYAKDSVGSRGGGGVVGIEGIYGDRRGGDCE